MSFDVCTYKYDAGAVRSAVYQHGLASDEYYLASRVTTGNQSRTSVLLFLHTSILPRRSAGSQIPWSINHFEPLGENIDEEEFIKGSAEKANRMSSRRGVVGGHEGSWPQ